MKIKLLDCTLRDGGYVNGWNFGRSTAICIFERLVSANIDIIEVGFLDERVDFDINRTIAPNTECFNKIFSGVSKKNALIFAMIDYGTCGINSITESKNCFLDGIRIIFKKNNVDGALELAKQIKSKGYLVSLQLVSMTSYSDRDVLDFVEKVNVISPYAVSIVDTYGLMHKEEMIRYFDLLNHNLSRNIIIGYHSHNNFQLAYSNTIELLKQKTARKISVDGTIYGMGKSAGNAPLELLAMHLNEYYEGKYNINQILEALDESIMRIYKENYWGYSFKYYLAALNDCHPDYITYLLNKKTLSVKSVNDIIIKIKSDKKLSFDESYIERLYMHYQEHYINDSLVRDKLREVFSKSKILVLAPGKSLKTHYDLIGKYIKENNPIVVSVNSIPDNYDINYIFISNSKRYSNLFEHISNEDMNKKIIATSNITSAKDPFGYVLDYNKLIGENVIADNSMMMFLQFLVQIGMSKVILAGFDGFSLDNDNYYDMSLNYHVDTSYLESINSAVIKKVSEYSKKMDIVFLTPSAYMEKKNG